MTRLLSALSVVAGILVGNNAGKFTNVFHSCSAS